MNNHSKKPLVDLQIKKMKNGLRLVDTNENRGLVVIKSKLGKITFFYRYQEKDTLKDRMMKMGDYPNMSLAEARVCIQQLKNDRNKGISPAEIKKQNKKQKEIITKQLTVKNIVDLYLKNSIEDRYSNDGKLIKGSRKLKGQLEVRRMLYADVIKVLGERIATEITRQDIIDLIQSIINRGANVQAGNVLREFNAVFEYAQGTGAINHDFNNPAFLAQNSLRMAKIRLTSKKGRRVLSEVELKKFLEWLPTCKLPEKAKQIFILTLYTGCRTGEWCNAKWDDINFDNKTFHIKLSKTDTERYVQLSMQASILLKEIAKTKKSQYIFTSDKTDKQLEQKKLTEYTWVLRKNNEMLNIDKWTPHDLRRTVRTGLSMFQCPNEIAEAIIGHSKKGIEGTYDLYSYDKECREWLQKWCDHLDSLPTKGNDISDLI